MTARLGGQEPPQEAVESVQKALGCEREQLTTRDGAAEVVCRLHHAYALNFKILLEGGWTDRGCPVAVAAADAAVEALGLTEETRLRPDGFGGQVVQSDGGVLYIGRPSTEIRRLVGPWTEATP